jgi:hypothetical protein
LADASQLAQLGLVQSGGFSGVSNFNSDGDKLRLNRNCVFCGLSCQAVRVGPSAFRIAENVIVR